MWLTLPCCVAHRVAATAHLPTGGTGGGFGGNGSGGGVGAGGIGFGVGCGIGLRLDNRAHCSGCP
jgi:hypothetical protein